MKKYFAFFISLVLTITAFAVPVSADENAVINISAKDSSHPISDKLYGLFIEDISYACDGGLVSNLVNNNSFEYQFNNLTAWTSDNVTLEIQNTESLNKSNPSYAVVNANGKCSITNLGYTEMYDYKSHDRNEKKASTADMGFKENSEYEFSCYINNKDFDGTVSVYLNSPKNKNNITELDISACGNIWSKIGATLTSYAQEDGGLTIEFNGTGTLYIDFVSLVPTNSYGYDKSEWKYTSLRSDLSTAIKQLNPGFIRFPGGCLAEGDSLDNLYSWKDTIGPLEERKQTYNLWRDDEGRDYINTNAMGYHEYFQLCKDFAAEPLPILNVGLTCQARAGYDDHVTALKKATMSAEEWENYLTESRNLDPEKNIDERNEYTSYIEGLGINSQSDFDNYLDTIALKPGTKEWNTYVQDILDLIDYANGNATTSYWGALRAANGSEEPFNLKYIGLGNENWGEIYERNFRALYAEIKKSHPEITVISSSGTYLEGEAYDQNWEWINKDYKDTIVDEHYYTYDGYLFAHNDRYDNFDRNGAHVFVGEYAATPKGIGTIETKSNIYEAVEEASFLTGIERNGDIVEMASYAPTFAKVNAQSWNVNLIWFDSQEVVLTPSYYVQQLFANNYGSKYLESTFENGETIQNGIYESVTVDENEQTLYIKLVNTTGNTTNVDINLADFGSINRVSSQSIRGAYKSACNEIGKNTTSPVETDLTANENITVELGKYDITVIRVAYDKNDGTALYTLPDLIDTMTTAATKYIPAAIKIGIPCGLAGGIIIAAAIIIIIKKRMKKSKK